MVDVLVVGLGATGAGAALDAATRGLTVAAIDAHDLAFGTSRWSSKLIHGGLRYLASGQFGVAHESAVERGVLMERTAPHLVRGAAVRPAADAAGHRGGQAALARAGFRAGDALRMSARTARAALPAPRRLSAVETLRLAPALRSYGLRGGLLSWDGRLVDDARLVTAVARTAAAHGARVLTRVPGARAHRRRRAGPRRAHRRGVRDPRPRGDQRHRRLGGRTADGIRLRPSRGTHLVLRAESLAGLSGGLHLPVPGSTGHFALVLPQERRPGLRRAHRRARRRRRPRCTRAPEAEIGFLLDVLDSALDVPVRREDVAGAYAGLRPLLDAGRPAAPPDLSRRHAVLTSGNGRRHDRRRQAHHVPAHGAGRGRRRGRGPGP